MNEVIKERTKLLANALDRASTACLTLGVFAPVAAAYFGAEALKINGWALAASAATWFGGALALHLQARHVLGGLTG